MRKVYALLVMLFFSLGASAHEGELLSIKMMSVTSPCDHVYFKFQIENVEEILLKNVEIELMAGGVSLASRSYNEFPPERFTTDAFAVNASALEGVDLRDLSINVTRIFDVAMDWGGWHGVDPTVANYNDIGDHEIFADAPWRMKIYNDAGAAMPVPINILAHDADQVWLGDKKQKIEYIDVYVKKSTESDFGDAVNFNHLDAAEFDALLKAKSPDRTDLDVQSFDLSLPDTDPNHTFAFRQSYDSNGDFDFTRLTHGWWFFTLMLPPGELDGFEDTDHLDIKVEFLMREDSGERYTRQSYLRVFRNTESMPTIPGFYRGDTHLHTYYSRSIIEFGNPISATKLAAAAIGIDWIIVTDHTSDFDNWPYHDIADTWERLGVEVNELNAEDESVRFIRGQEVSLLNAQHKLVHFLAYPGYETPRDLPYMGDGGGDAQVASVLSTNVLKRLNDIGGFAYAAHPFATTDNVVGSWWNVGDPDFPHNGELFQEGHPVNCNDINEPSDLFSLRSDEVVLNRLKGAQIWGVRYSLSGETDPHDPFNIREEAGASQFEAAPQGETNHLVKYRQGEEVVNFVNKKALKLKNQNLELKNFKFYFSAGTDAHGSFNYSNTSGFGTVFTDNEEVEVNSNAVGGITCVTYCPEGPGPEGEHALKAMHDGNFSVSDGPLLVMGASTNGNDTENEVLMGADIVLSETDLMDLYVNFEFVSTVEFGAFEYLRIFVGTEDGEQSFLVDDLEDYGASFSYTLEELTEAAGMLLPVDQYFYVRAELGTKAEYGPNSPHIIELEEFHSFTNPVWFNISHLVTGVDDELSRSFNIYPNPVDKFLYLEASVSIDAVSVYDAEGKFVLQSGTPGNGVDVSGLPAGTYTLVTLSDGNLASRNFVVQ